MLRGRKEEAESQLFVKDQVSPTQFELVILIFFISFALMMLKTNIFTKAEYYNVQVKLKLQFLKYTLVGHPMMEMMEDSGKDDVPQYILIYLINY
jgi:hypothetical protein